MIKGGLTKRIDSFLEKFQTWLEKDTESRHETFDVKWMSAHEYLGRPSYAPDGTRIDKRNAA